jgi:hypothetical protein
MRRNYEEPAAKQLHTSVIPELASCVKQTAHPTVKLKATKHALQADSRCERPSAAVVRRMTGCYESCPHLSAIMMIIMPPHKYNAHTHGARHWAQTRAQLLMLCPAGAV